MEVACCAPPLSVKPYQTSYIFRCFYKPFHTPRHGLFRILVATWLLLSVLDFRTGMDGLCIHTCRWPDVPCFQQAHDMFNRGAVGHKRHLPSSALPMLELETAALI
jgi:hypothetical protein